MTAHTPVLLKEVVDALMVQPNDVVVDCTLGGAGHALALASKLSKDGTFVGIDLDPEALERAQERLKDFSCKKIFVESNYKNLESILKTNEIKHVDKMLIDLGLSSDQLDASGRGFSFTKDEPLSMTFGKGHTFDAAEIVNTWDEENLATIFQNYGEEKFARRIARTLVTAREKETVKTTHDLVKIIEQALPTFILKTARKHPATRVFQALRMTVNDEYPSLVEGVNAAKAALAPEGRIAVITFESIMDRAVKHSFKKWVEEGEGKVLTKKPITPTQDEIEKNPRARSAKLRVFIKN